MQANTVIEKRGEKLSITRRTKTGEDDYGKPVYEWVEQAEEYMFLHPLTSEEVRSLAGEFTVNDIKGFFRNDSIIQENDRITWNDATYEVKGRKVWKLSGSTTHIECFLKEAE